jgi:hypothetical protein
MIAELKIFENLKPTELEKEVSGFLRIKVKSIEKSTLNKRLQAILNLLMTHRLEIIL